jgi:hypothetical protein
MGDTFQERYVSYYLKNIYEHEVGKHRVLSGCF